MSELLELGLHPSRLLPLYRAGIFPWPDLDGVVTYYRPEERMVLFPENLHVSRNARRTLRQNKWRITLNMDFEAVVHSCRRAPRLDQEGSWITTELITAYSQLHFLGKAHSVEVWEESRLIGGLFGISIGAVFCGESMFSLSSNASRVAFATFIPWFQELGGRLVDCQVHTDYLAQMGAGLITSAAFAGQLEEFCPLQLSWPLNALLHAPA